MKENLKNIKSYTFFIDGKDCKLKDDKKYPLGTGFGNTEIIRCNACIYFQGVKIDKTTLKPKFIICGYK